MRKLRHYIGVIYYSAKYFNVGSDEKQIIQQSIKSAAVYFSQVASETEIITNDKSDTNELTINLVRLSHVTKSNSTIRMCFHDIIPTDGSHHTTSQFDQIHPPITETKYTLSKQLQCVRLPNNKFISGLLLINGLFQDIHLNHSFTEHYLGKRLANIDEHVTFEIYRDNQQVAVFTHSDKLDYMFELYDAKNVKQRMPPNIKLDINERSDIITIEYYYNGLKQQFCLNQDFYTIHKLFIDLYDLVKFEKYYPSEGLQFLPIYSVVIYNPDEEQTATLPTDTRPTHEQTTDTRPTYRIETNIRHDDWCICKTIIVSNNKVTQMRILVNGTIFYDIKYNQYQTTQLFTTVTIHELLCIHPYEHDKSQGRIIERYIKDVVSFDICIANDQYRGIIRAGITRMSFIKIKNCSYGIRFDEQGRCKRAFCNVVDEDKPTLDYKDATYQNGILTEYRVKSGLQFYKVKVYPNGKPHTVVTLQLESEVSRVKRCYRSDGPLLYSTNDVINEKRTREIMGSIPRL